MNVILTGVIGGRVTAGGLGTSLVYMFDVDRYDVTRRGRSVSVFKLSIL
jgi:hypothetical protein